MKVVNPKVDQVPCSLKRATIRKLLGAVAAVTIVYAPSAAAQAFPAKPVRIIVPFGPGSGADIIARILADKLGEQMNASFVVENRDGAGGSIGTTLVAKSPPDGYTLALIPSSYTVNLLPTAPYDPVKDFEHVARVASLPLVLVASQDAPFKTFAELIAYAKANPGKLNYANSGRGATTHLEMELLKKRYQLDVQDIPYKSFNTAIADVITGRVAFYYPAFPAVIPFIKSGQVRALGVGSEKRSEHIPDVPTMAEAANAPGYQAGTWYGILAPAGTPAAVVKVLDSNLALALKSSDVQKRFAGANVSVDYESAAKFRKTVEEETAKWEKLVEELGLKKAR